MRALRAFCALTGHPAPEVFHTNEGHAGFLGLERIREYAEAGIGFDEAIELCRAGTVFTTHTPVPAGIDTFPRSLVERQFTRDTPGPALPADRVLALGAETYPGGDPEVFNMAVMGMRLAQRVNSVCQLHGDVSRQMFAGLWPGFEISEVPIGSITNGVHAATWVAPEIFGLEAGPGVADTGLAGQESAPADALPEDVRVWEQVAAASPDRIWEVRRLLRARLVAMARERLHAAWRQRGSTEAELTWISEALDEDVLTIGFARRVAAYKRLTLILHDPERLTALLIDPQRPVQLVIAGKAHPADDGGKRLIQQMVRFADNPQVRHRIVFLPDYDMGLARVLVQGCDVWLNNPVRPLEACGISGMKSARNGGLNLSIGDGWWDEWYDGQNGWVIPSADGVEDPARRDKLESAALYDLLEQTVTPLFYDGREQGLPLWWLDMVAHTLGDLGPRVQASRMVRDYVIGMYLPAARACRALVGEKGSEEEGPAYMAARELAAWKNKVALAWHSVSIEHIEADAGLLAPGQRLQMRAEVAPGELLRRTSGLRWYADGWMTMTPSSSPLSIPSSWTPRQLTARLPAMWVKLNSGNPVRSGTPSAFFRTIGCSPAPQRWD